MRNSKQNIESTQNQKLQSIAKTLHDIRHRYSSITRDELVNSWLFSASFRYIAVLDNWGLLSFVQT